MTSIDTLYFQWVVNDEDKKEPTIFENIQELPLVSKINDLLNTYGTLVSDLIEAEVARRVQIDSYIETVQEDPELAELPNDELAQGIFELDDVQEHEQLVETQRNALDMFHESLVKVLAGEE